LEKLKNVPTPGYCSPLDPENRAGAKKDTARVLPTYKCNENFIKQLLLMLIEDATHRKIL
jgi:hypothetical protein